MSFSQIQSPPWGTTAFLTSVYTIFQHIRVKKKMDTYGAISTQDGMSVPLSQILLLSLSTSLSPPSLSVCLSLIHICTYIYTSSVSIPLQAPSHTRIHKWCEVEHVHNLNWKSNYIILLMSIIEITLIPPARCYRPSNPYATYATGLEREHNFI